MRLFVAVVPPVAETERLDAAIGDRDPRLRWVPMGQWHVTVVFCGEVAPAAVPELTERLGRAAHRTPVLSLQLAGAGTFPRQVRRARHLWVGLGGDVEGLGRLADRCAAAARRVGIGVEDRAYRPHLTLARARRDVVDMSEHVAALSSYAGQAWSVTTIRLVHSTLGSVVTHNALAEFPLAASEVSG